MSEELKSEYLAQAKAKRESQYNHAKAIQRNAIALVLFFAIMSVLTTIALANWIATQSRLENTQKQLRSESLKAAEFEDWYNRTCVGEPISANGVCDK